MATFYPEDLSCYDVDVGLLRISAALALLYNEVPDVMKQVSLRCVSSPENRSSDRMLRISLQPLRPYQVHGFLSAVAAVFDVQEANIEKPFKTRIVSVTLENSKKGACIRVIPRTGQDISEFAVIAAIGSKLMSSDQFSWEFCGAGHECGGSDDEEDDDPDPPCAV